MSGSTLFDLSGHGYFIWASYGMLALAILFELVFLRKRRLRALMQASLIAKEAPARQARVKEAGPGPDATAQHNVKPNS